MKIWKVSLVALALVAAVAGLIGCTGASTPTAAGSTVATVSRGNVSVDITAAGNLALSQTEDLAFQLDGYVLSVDVKAGDSVKKGQELAKLDTTDYDKQIKSLTQAVTTAQRSLADKQNNVITAQRQVTSLQRTVIEKENAVSKAEQTVAEKELAVQSAQLDIQSAQDDLNTIAEVKQIQDAIDGDQTQIDLINLILKGISGGGLQVTDGAYWSLQKSNAKTALAEDQQNLADLLAGKDIHVTQEIDTQVAQANLQVQKMKMALVDAQTALSDANTE